MIEPIQQTAMQTMVEVHSSPSDTAQPAPGDRIQWAEAIAPVVGLAYEELSYGEGTDRVETVHYSIKLDRMKSELLLYSKVIAADGLSRVDFDRFIQKRQKLKDYADIGWQEQKVSLER
jgi:hypothetical protein